MGQDPPDPRTDSVPAPGQFSSVGEWFDYVRAEGYNVPIQVPRAISLAGGELGLSDQDAFDWLKDRGLIIVRNSIVAFDVRATRPEFWQAVRDAGGEFDSASDG